MGKREDFKKGLAALGAIGTFTVFSFGMDAIEEKNDLSKYAMDDDKYIKYVNETDAKKLEKLWQLDDNIKKYEELMNKNSLSDEEKSELDNLTMYLKSEMKSGNLERFFLQDVFKSKIKEAYGVKDVETRWRDDEGMHIKLIHKNGKIKAMDDKDKIRPLVIAMKNIALLQDYENKDEFSKKDIDNFIKIQKNMKGFSNLNFIKVDGKPLSYAQIDIDKDDEISLD